MSKRTDKQASSKTPITRAERKALRKETGSTPVEKQTERERRMGTADRFQETHRTERNTRRDR